jgi:alanine-glyoxylate transaminase/serine-glyoxylate transaminase/serine-pyruvate transaminase
VRQRLLGDFNIEMGAGLGPLAGKIWRVGLMGASSTPSTVLLFLGALEHVLHSMGHKGGRGAVAAAMEGLV